MAQARDRNQFGAAMKTLTILDSPDMLKTGLGGDCALDLVAHFLGIATHDNVNAAPSVLKTAKTGSTAENS